MLVEDVKDYQDLVVLTLSLEPYRKIVYMADSGEEGLEGFAEAFQPWFC